MKRIIYLATFTLALNSIIPAAYADEGYGRGTHLVHTGAHPNVVGTPNATHHFELHVAGNSLSQLQIDLPYGVTVPKSVEIKDRSGAKIDNTVSTNNRKVTIAFAQPVAPGNILSVSMEGIEVSKLIDRVLLYPIYGKFVGLTADIRLGTVRIQTYR
jgi:hypothetical protein